MPRMRGIALLSALPYVIKRQDEEEAYRYYVTDSLYYPGKNMVLNRRFYDVLHKREQKEDNRTGDEIALELVEKMGLKQDGSV